MRKRRALLLGAIAAIAAVIAGVTAATSSGKQQEQLTIAFVPPVIANPTIQALNSAIHVKGKSLGMKVLTLGGEFNPQAQIVAANAALQRNVDVFMTWPLDPKGFEPTLARFIQKKIPVFVIVSPKVRNATMNFQYNDFLSARDLAKLAAAELKRQGRECSVGIIEGIPLVDVLRDRNEGLAAGAKAAGCKILEHQVNQKDNSDGARPIAQAWATKWGSKMTAVLAYNDPSALGALSVASGNFKPIVTGMNGDSLAIQALKQKRLFATSAVPNVELGNAMAYAAWRVVAKKQKVPRQVNLTFEILTQQNVNRYATFEQRLKKPEQIKFVQQGGKWVVKATPNYAARTQGG